MALAKKTKRTLAYTAIIGGCAVLALTFFTVSQLYKAKYQASVTVQLSSKSNLDKYLTKDPSALDEGAEGINHDYAVFWQGVYNDFTRITKENSTVYNATAIPAYAFSMATLVAFGLVLKHAEKTKEKEEQEV